MRNFLLLIFISSLLSGCKTDEQAKTETPATNTEAQKPAIEEVAAIQYPSYPQEKVKILWDESDYVDIVFYYEDFSISQKRQSDIRGMLNYISTGVPKIDPACQPIGRIFFQIKGRNAAEADIHFSQGCTFFIFYEDGKKTYANGFTESGVNFFNNIFASVRAKKPK